MANPAVAVIARWEWARRWRSLLVLGVAGGLLGGLVVGGAVLARRTISAPDRLYRAVAPGDVHLRLFDARFVDDVQALPDVTGAWVAGVAVGRIEHGQGLQYAGVIAPTQTDDRLVQPVIVAGRAAAPGAPDEVVATEAIVDAAGVSVSDRLVLTMLSAEEVFQFDTGFGDPDGPVVELTVVGIARVTPGMFDGSPLLATPAFAAAHTDLFAGYDLRLAVRGDRAAAVTVVDQVTALVGAGDPANDDFSPVAADIHRDGTDRLIRAAHVLFAGLIAAVVVAALAVAAGLAQAWSRHHGATTTTQRVESALGLASAPRVLARVVPALPAAAIAGLVAAAVGVLASRVEPVGNLWRSEPSPRWRLDLAAVLGGAAAVAVLIVAIAAATAWRAGRSRVRGDMSAVGRRLRVVPARRGWPFVGASFALSRGGPRHVPVRMSLAGCVLGVAGIVGSLCFTASLDRLVDTPQRWGWNADVSIADVDDALVDRLAADWRFDAVAEVASAETSIDGRPADAYAVRNIRGDAGWVLQQGRLPAADDEVVLGGRLAHDLRRRVGDTITAGSLRFTVVGIGLGPSSNLEPLGSSVLFTTEGLAVSAATGRFREALLRVADEHELDAVLGDYAAFEMIVRTAPNEVRDVSELGSLPMLLGLFVAALAAIALLHALVVTGASRAGDLAVLRALGGTPRQSGLTIVAMALTSAAVGLVGGLPLGVALARLLWGEVARSIGVRADLAVPWTLLFVVAGAAVVAVVLALAPALRARRRPPAEALRAA
ncbi:MAG: ABC transporter permease [Ilumatobacteraceae bacterium]